MSFALEHTIPDLKEFIFVAPGSLRNNPARIMQGIDC
jgi:hypothetical protein